MGKKNQSINGVDSDVGFGMFISIVAVACPWPKGNDMA
jgi:hypothetical protein